MARVIGVHNAQPINKIDWGKFTTWWKGKTPSFAGRYFGPVGAGNRPYPWTAWKDGEGRDPSNLPPASLQYVFAFQGVTAANNTKMTNGDQGGAVVDAAFTCARLTSAIAVGSLKLPPSNIIDVYLDVETWNLGMPLALHPDYWNSWARHVSAYHLYMSGRVYQPFRPCIYCHAENSPNAPAGTVSYVPHSTIRNALDGINPLNPQGPRITAELCCGLWYPRPLENSGTGTLALPEISAIHLLDLDEMDLALCVNHYPDYTQSAPFPIISATVPVSVWQYGGNVPYTQQATPPVMDLDFTVSDTAINFAMLIP